MPCYSASYECPLSKECVCTEQYSGYECQHKICPTNDNPKGRPTANLSPLVDVVLCTCFETNFRSLAGSLLIDIFLCYH